MNNPLLPHDTPSVCESAAELVRIKLNSAIERKVFGEVGITFKLQNGKVGHCETVERTVIK